MKSGRQRGVRGLRWCDSSCASAVLSPWRDYSRHLLPSRTSRKPRAPVPSDTVRDNIRDRKIIATFLFVLK